MDEKYAFVMMIQEKWWRGFCQCQREGKETQSYVQGGWAPPKETSLLLFYVTKPVGQVAGSAEFIERKVGDAADVWNEHGDESVLQTRERYEEFVGDKERVSFIRFKNLREASEPIPLKNVLMFLGLKRLSRKGFYVDKETADELIALMK
jgi:predicted transcriptional regulator